MLYIYIMYILCTSINNPKPASLFEYLKISSSPFVELPIEVVHTRHFSFPTCIPASCSSWTRVEFLVSVGWSSRLSGVPYMDLLSNDRH